MGVGEQDYSDTDTAAAAENVESSPDVVSLTDELANQARQANRQRGVIFWFILIGTGLMLCVDLVVVMFLGREFIHLDTPVAVAFISAVSVQSFGLISALTFGLYRSSKAPASPPE